MRFALDQNFPVKLIEAMAEFFPPGLDLKHVHKIDPALSELDDDELVVELQAREFDGLITTDYRLLDDPKTVSALCATKLIAVIVEAAGHDPLKASGALFLELPSLPHRLARRESNVIFIRKHRPVPSLPAWEYLERIAERQGTSAADLYEEHKPDLSRP